MALSIRLQSILDLCQPGLPLWDLCCDHGYLGLEALRRGQFSQVIFNDAVPHVLADLEARLGNLGLGQTRAICCLAEDIDEPLTGNVVLAGIGGEKILKICTSQIAKNRLRAERLIFCPEKDAEWLALQPIPGFKLLTQSKITHNRGYRWILSYYRA